MPMTTEYAPFNGKPYYCCVCGLGIGEFMACDSPDCKLESDESAQQRAELYKYAMTKDHGLKAVLERDHLKICSKANSEPKP